MTPRYWKSQPALRLAPLVPRMDAVEQRRRTPWLIDADSVGSRCRLELLEMVVSSGKSCSKEVRWLLGMLWGF